MIPSLHAFLAGIVDYAGLFPPARLPLDQAIRNYARYRREPDNWMLGRFVCPAVRLADLEPFVDELFLPGDVWKIAALGRGGRDADDLATGCRVDREAVEAFRERHGEQAVIDVFEVRVSPDVVAAPGERLPAIHAVLEPSPGIECLTVYYELTLAADWRPALASLVGRLAELPGRPAGFKLRCGGLEAAAFPSAEQVAFTITACRNAGVPLKFTAGLHHPLRHLDRALQTRAHGFLNVFGAGVLASTRKLNEGQVQAIIEAEEPGDFFFDEEGFRWKDWRASTDEIRDAREKAVVSFGSCSFDEPREDLRALGLLP